MSIVTKHDAEHTPNTLWQVKACPHIPELREQSE